MLQEEFVALVQKELGRSCESEADAVCQDVSLSPLVLHSKLLRLLNFHPKVKSSLELS